MLTEGIVKRSDTSTQALTKGKKQRAAQRVFNQFVRENFRHLSKRVIFAIDFLQLVMDLLGEHLTSDLRGCDSKRQ